MTICPNKLNLNLLLIEVTQNAIKLKCGLSKQTLVKMAKNAWQSDYIDKISKKITSQLRLVLNFKFQV